MACSSREPLSHVRASLLLAVLCISLIIVRASDAPPRKSRSAGYAASGETAAGGASRHTSRTALTRRSTTDHDVEPAADNMHAAGNNSEAAGAEQQPSEAAILYTLSPQRLAEHCESVTLLCRHFAAAASYDLMIARFTQDRGSETGVNAADEALARAAAKGRCKQRPQLLTADPTAGEGAEA